MTKTNAGGASMISQTARRAATTVSSNSDRTKA